MATLFKKVTLVVAKRYYKGGDGQEFTGLSVFTSLAHMHSMRKVLDEDGSEDKYGFLGPYAEVEAWIPTSKFHKITAGLVTPDDVSFPTKSAERISRLSW